MTLTSKVGHIKTRSPLREICSCLAADCFFAARMRIPGTYTRYGFSCLISRLAFSVSQGLGFDRSPATSLATATMGCYQDIGRHEFKELASSWPNRDLVHNGAS